MMRTIEFGLWFVGLVTLCYCFYASAENSRAERDARAKFTNHLENLQLARTTEDIVEPSMKPSSQPFKDISRPSMDDWSSTRVAAYEKNKHTDDDPLGVLRIPSIELEVVVYFGTEKRTLDRGAGVVEGSAGPHRSGNFAIAGHRDGFFRPLRNLSVGNEITFETSRAIYRYQVDGIEIVKPEDVDVLQAHGDRTLTLVTCYPFYFVGSAPQRYIVKARQIEASLR